MLFAIRTEASVLRMLEGSPQTCLHDPILKYLDDRGVRRGVRAGPIVGVHMIGVHMGT
jgi:zeta-carotene desaturase